MRLSQWIRTPKLSLRVAVIAICIVLALFGCDGDPGGTGDAGGSGAEGPEGPIGPVVDTGAAQEGCLDCHGSGAVSPVFDVNDAGDAHWVDRDVDGPQTPSGYRTLVIDILEVDVRGNAVEFVFHVANEVPDDVDDIFAGDGRFGLARLLDPAGPGDPTTWDTLIRSETFTTTGGAYTPEGSGAYRYRSAYDPTTAGLTAGDTLRLAIQLSASDLPAANGVCDFDATLSGLNNCTSGTQRTRDIVPTSQCNSCHGVTSETRLAYHGGGRVEVEYCVVCHNPGIGETNLGPLTHKIHAGATLENGFRKWSHVQYPRDLADCTTCHGGGGVDEANWYDVPTRDACGACHDGIDFDTGAGHGSGGQQLDNSRCTVCHPAQDDGDPANRPVQDVHRGVERRTRAAEYRGNDNGNDNGFAIEDLTWDSGSDELTVRYSVTHSGTKLDLETDPAFGPGGGSGRVNLRLAWATSDYTNEGADSGSKPAQPLQYSGTDFDEVSNVGGEVFERVIAVPSAAFDTATVTLDGYPATDLDGADFDEALPVRSAFAHALVDGRGGFEARRTSVEIGKCNLCHDAAGAGLSLHGSNRTSEVVACVVCHNPDATDLGARPADPGDALDGKREESVDFKRMIHAIHAGSSLEQGLVVYGFGGSAHDYSSVGFIGNLRNCETCHVDATPTESSYGALAASTTRASTLDTGAAVDRPDDDLNVSPVAAVCSSCHDGQVARDHMLLKGASFQALGADIH